MKIKRRFLIPIISILLLGVFFVAGLFWWSKVVQPVGSDSTTESFLILRGRSAGQIANSLYEEGFIKNPLAFKFYVQLTGKSKSIQAGEFALSKNLNLYQIVERLSKGPQELWVTVPEGLRREEVAEKFVEALGMDPIQASTFRKEFIETSIGMEGYLFPDTYLFPKDVAAVDAVEKMRNTFDAKMSTEIGSIIEESNYPLKSVVTMASILEREARDDSERPVVAGILYKRLEAGWPLQADATVQYAAGNVQCKGFQKEAGRPLDENVKCDNWWPILTRDDLEMDSPYNTYKYQGLPPAPISNPGLSSLTAAISPTDSDYWYYIHDSDGSIHYARDLSEHNENVRVFLRK